MIFFFKKSTVNIDCFTHDEIVFNNFRPDRANKFVPKEWKDLAPSFSVRANRDPNSNLQVDVNTLKKCNGITELFSNGFIIPNWADFQIEMKSNGTYNVANLSPEEPNTTFSQHGREQYGNEFYKDCGHIKINSPWFLKESTGVKFAWNSCSWHNTNNLQNFYILPGIIDFKLQSGTHVNAFQKNSTITTWHAGDPLVQLMPLSDKKIKLTYHFLDLNNINKIINRERTALRYNNGRNLKAKCPF